MTCAESIQKNLISRLENVDVFMSVATRETPSEPKVNDTSVCESLRNNKGDLICQIDKDFEIPIFDSNIKLDFN